MNLKKRKRKQWYYLVETVVLVVSFSAIVLVATGSNISFLMAKQDAVVNEFKPSTVTSDVVETFDNKIKSDVKIKNTGDTEAYIRAAVVVTWQNDNGEVYPKMPTVGTDYTIDFNGTDWIAAGDGYYYYKNPVAAGDVTAVLINKAQPVDGKTPAGYGLNVEILGDAIQSLPVQAVENSWKVTVETDRTITKL